MNIDVILNVLQVLLYVVLGGIAIWFQTNTKLRDKAKNLIDEAETLFTDTTKAGGKRFEWVVDNLITLLPAPIRPFIPRAVVEQIVQSIFDAMKSYAQKTLDSIVDKCGEGDEETENSMDESVV